MCIRDRANKDLMSTQLFTNRAMVAMMPFMTLIMNGTSLLIVWFGGKAMDAGTMQVGEMIAFITYTMQIVMSLSLIHISTSAARSVKRSTACRWRTLKSAPWARCSPASPTMWTHWARA